MIRTLVTIFAGLFGLATGSYLNVCASRWPEGESTVKPRSHCSSCGRTLAWWENIPLASWLGLGGRCRSCKAPIGWRHLWVELIVGVLWAFAGWEIFAAAPELSFGIFDYNAAAAITDGVGRMIFLWLLVALAVLDIENLWLPDRLTLPGIGLGLVLATTRGSLDAFLRYGGSFAVWKHLVATDVVLFWLLGAVLSAGVLLLIRWVYGLIRREEGVGLGDVKLMALLGGWLGARCAVLALGFGAILGTVVALLLLATPAMRADREAWRQKKLPMGAFIAVGGVFSAFWGEQLIAAYRQWSGLW